MTEIIEITAGYFYAQYPLTQEGLELAKKFIELIKLTIKQ